MTPGFFLSLDGPDGAGKSTQVRRLADWLASLGLDIVSCSDPGGTPLGSELRQILLHHDGPIDLRAEALLFMASRAQLVAEVIQPALSAGKWVISDRFLLANVVYQGHAGGLPVDELWRVGELSTAGLSPDLTIILDVPPDEATKRRKPNADRLERRPAEYHRRVREGFLLEARRQPGRMLVVDASGNADAVQAALQAAVKSRLPARDK